MIINITRFKTTKTLVTYENYKYAMFDIVDFLNKNFKDFQSLPLSLEWEEDNTLNLYQDGKRLGWYSSNPDKTDWDNFISDLNSYDPQGFKVEIHK